MQLELKILDDRITSLDYATNGAAAVDLRACSIDGKPLGVTLAHVIIAPGMRVMIGTGIAIDLGSDEIFTECAALVLPRSGLGSRGITLGNAPGLIDSDYQGEITLALWNAGPDEFRIEPLARLAQLLIVPTLRPQFHPVVEFSRVTRRGAGGFGHTGSN